MEPLNLDDFITHIDRPDSGVRRDAEDWRAGRSPRAGTLGKLDELGQWLAAAQGGLPVKPIGQPKVVLFAGDHGVASLSVSANESGTAVRFAKAALAGESAVAILARRYGAALRVVDMSLDCDPAELPEEVTKYRVRRGSGRIDVEDAMTREEAEQAFRTGMAIADEEADAGTDLLVLGDLSVGGTTAAGAIVAALCGTDASVVTGRGGSGIDDLAWMRKCAAIRDALRRARPVLGDQLELLQTVGGPDLAAMTGFLLQAAVRKTPVIIDGVVSSAAALVGQRAAFRAPDWWVAGQSTGEPAQAKALDRIAIEPLLDHGVTAGEGVGALMALPLLQAAAELWSQLPERAVHDAQSASVDDIT
ncbi:nicotinate-nucleotide--dimethylbenzimidazole phosphoribosyltransferase [Streptomyces sp. NPDC051940]|uniref:nicotinate-nucleotide--dimethylbenzimidazole phosphoribosyltransferase n=1 Tax=Streptomyces sp. NPDC051940 TaxID=3155675 RepID=UPI003444269B